MKKILVFAMAVLFGVSHASADNFTVGNIIVPQGGSSVIEIGLNNTDNLCKGFQFLVSFDGAVTASSPVKGARVGGEYTLNGSQKEDGYQILAYTMGTTPLAGTSGTIVSLTLTADAGLAVGATVSGTLSNGQISDEVGTISNLDDVNFTITIGEPSDGRTVLDETSITLPEDAAGVDVRVLRTIKANEWSTIVLPFAMDNTQLKAAFGDDVQLADFTSWESEEDEYGDIININIGFTDVTEIEANHPYIIKVSGAISEFTVDDVDIEVEDEPTVQVGKKKSERGYFIGTYVAQTTVPEDNLFLNSNMFWYSAGLTKMKAFRGYFELADVLAEAEASSAKVLMHVGDIATVIDGTEMNIQGKVQGVYSIQGTFLGKEVDVNQLPDGLYIIDGKKVSVKK